MRLLLLFIILWITQPVFSQSESSGKEVPEKKWPAECKKVEIVSTADHAVQHAYFFRAKSDQPRPLMVRLHAWSSDYTKVDGVAQLCIDMDYNYIFPDFRGPNNRPEACGSPLVIQDIEDAIDYVISHADVDTANIHIIGGSGGGHATLLCYMKIKRQIKTFTAWASITNLVDYYYQCAGRREKYGKYMDDLKFATSGLPENGFIPYFNQVEAVKRSPVLMDTPVALRENSKLYIYAGIHDGCLGGDVPFTHSLKFFNKVVSDFGCTDPAILFSSDEMLQLIDWQTTGEPVEKQQLEVLLQRQYQDKVQLTLFEGGHEMIPDRIMDGVEGRNTLVGGDSNGAIPSGGVNQLKEERLFSPPAIIKNPASTQKYKAEARNFTGIPSLAISDSCLWVTWYAGITPAEDQNSYVVVAVSKDKGLTWEEVFVIDPDGSGPERAYDPQAWIAPNGKLWIFWAQQGTRSGVWAITSNQPNNISPEWSEPRRITDGTMMGKPLVLSGGEWAITPSSRFVDNSARLVISADQGKNWQERGAVNIPEPERNCDEHTVAEKKNGSLWMLVRIKSGMGESISSDAGKTWTPMIFSKIMHPNSRFFLRRLQSGNLLLVKHGPVGIKTERSHLMAFLSKDDGISWSKGLLLDERLRASYPDGQQDKDGKVFIVYDYLRTKDQTIFITSFTEDDIWGSDYDSNVVNVFQQRKIVSRGGFDKK